MEMSNLPFTTQDICEGLASSFHNNVYNDGSFVVWLILNCQPRERNTVEITLKEIGKRAGYSEWKVTEIMNTLVEKGIIKRAHNIQGKRQKYVIL